MSRKNTRNDKIQTQINLFPGLLSPATQYFLLELFQDIYPNPTLPEDPALAMASAYFTDNLDITAPSLPLGNQK